MNWIRDNILKIVLITFVIIVIAVVIVACSMGGSAPVDSASGYIELENRIQNAAISYVNEHQSILPKTTDTIKKVKLNTLIEAGKINKMYAVDDKSVVCKGHVEIEKISEDSKLYRYTPYISCGKYYVTKTISDYIIDKETQNGEFVRTADDGLYEMNGEYVYRGEYPENYILLGEKLYRIMKIGTDKNLELISVEPTWGYYGWDDRYNISEDYNLGINNFVKSRIYQSLKTLYENNNQENGEIFFTDAERQYIVEHDFCIGRRDVSDANIYSGVECNETIPMKVGLVSINEPPRASLDPNCIGLYDKSCSNYNFYTRLNGKNSDSLVSLTASSSDTFTVYVYDGRTKTTATDDMNTLHPVIYIGDKVIYKSGSGTKLDPYVVR